MLGMRENEFSIWLRLEAAAILIVTLVCFSKQQGSWAAFAALFLVPDLSMLGYLKGNRIGAFLYNFFHSYSVAALTLLVAYFTAGGTLDACWWVWPAHIAFDRMMGYGLKSWAGFHHTHLGKAGGKASQVIGAKC
jgi:hypothetical protein